MPDKIFENKWDCPACGRVGNSAFKQKHCPACGYGKTSQDAEYMGDEITNADDLKVAGKTKDWICSNCQSTNYQKNDFCENCGNPKDGSDKVNQKINYGSTPPRTHEEARERSHPKTKIESASSYSYPPVSSYSSEPWSVQSSLDSFAEKTGIQLNTDTLKIGGIVVAVLLFIAVLFFSIFHTKDVNGTVTAFNWTRDIPIEVYKTVRHTHESIQQSGAYNVRSYQESRQVPVYKTVTTHHSKTCTSYTNNGDGTTTQHTEDCSYDTSESVLDHYDTVWDTYYDYDRDEWVYEYTAHTQGSDQKPYWPVVKLNRDSEPIIGAERKSIPFEKYSVVFATYDKKEKRTDYIISPNQPEWSQYKMEESYPLKINSFGIVMNNPLQDKIKSVATAKP